MKKKCEYCGIIYETDADQCPGCGAPLIEVSENTSSKPDTTAQPKLSKYATPSQPEPMKKSSKVIIFLIIFFIGILIIGAVLFPCILSTILAILGKQ